MTYKIDFFTIEEKCLVRVERWEDEKLIKAWARKYNDRLHSKELAAAQMLQFIFEGKI